MKKLLLIWNLILTTLLTVIIINGCSALNPQLDALTAEVRTNRQLIEELSALANSNREAVNGTNEAIAANKVLIETFADITENNIKTLEGSLTQYIEQYVEAYVNQVIGAK